MVSLDQVILLEQKVESAVAKIQQLQAENDALRNKCLELTNALSSKSEQLTSFESDQNQIESGIKKALDRLNFIENSLLKSVGQAASTSSTNSTSSLASNTKLEPTIESTIKPSIKPTINQNIEPKIEPSETINQAKPELTPENSSDSSDIKIPSFYNMEPAINTQENDSVSVAEQELEETVNDISEDISIPRSSENNSNPVSDSENFEIFDDSENSDELGFDIF